MYKGFLLEARSVSRRGTSVYQDLAVGFEIVLGVFVPPVMLRKAIYEIRADRMKIYHEEGEKMDEDEDIFDDLVTLDECMSLLDTLYCLYNSFIAVYIILSARMFMGHVEVRSCCILIYFSHTLHYLYIMFFVFVRAVIRRGATIPTMNKTLIKAGWNRIEHVYIGWSCRQCPLEISYVRAFNKSNTPLHCPVIGTDRISTPNPDKCYSQQVAHIKTVKHGELGKKIPSLSLYCVFTLSL